MTNKSRGEAVLTPGGYRSPNDVHLVSPGDVIVRDSDKGGHFMTVENRVLTPGGFRSRSLVHFIEPGHALIAEGDTFRKQNLSSHLLTDIEMPPSDHSVPALGSGWVTYAYWNNGTGKPFTAFNSTWIVPPPPAAQANPQQTIFLFNGIQNFGSNFGILQPVLQWGPSAAGGGNYWSIASWYVTSGGQAFHTQLTQVSPGDHLVGVMTRTGSAGSSFSYLSEFLYKPTTRLPVQNITELLWFNETLEAYEIQQCTNYPNCDKTAFTDIAIRSDAGSLPPVWTPVNRIADCGQHTKVPGPTEVDLYYRAGDVA